jgi:hypothetical protein
MRHSGRLLIAVWVASTATATAAAIQPLAPSAPGHHEGERAGAWTAPAAQALAMRGDAPSLATAALLDLHEGADRAARASELAPESAAIAWVRLRVCANNPGCDLREAATAMRWIDADNAAAWLPTLAAAVKDHDTVEVERVLGDMARGRRFDLYWNTIVVMMFDALKAAGRTLPPHSPLSDAPRLAAVVGIAAAGIVPPFSPLAEACRDAATGTDRRDACLKIAKLLQQGDTVIAEMLGCSIERRLLPEGARESRTLADHRRVLEWRMSVAGRYDAPLLPWLKNAHARWRVARMRNSPREQDVVTAVLREEAMPLYPPEDHR